MTRVTEFFIGLLAAVALAVRAVWRRAGSFLRELFGLFGLIQTVQKRHRRRWVLRVRGLETSEPDGLTDEEIARLLRRGAEFDDFAEITRMGARFRLPETDFHVTREQVEEIVRRILVARPPFLFLGRVPLRPEDAGAPRVERIRKRQVVHIQGPEMLLVPEPRPVRWAAASPPGEQSVRPASGISELRRASLLDQVLPFRLQLERLSRGDVRVVEYVTETPNVEFVARERWVDYEEEREVDIEIEMESTDPNAPIQLIYFLVDRSASMKGMSAVHAMAVLAAIHRANLSRPALYLFRSFADRVDPPWTALPRRAETVEEREGLFETMLTLNFNGESTQTGWALDTACLDIDAARAEGREIGLASIVLITDGRSDLLPRTIATVLKCGAPLHTIVVSRDRNPDLARISASYTLLAGLPGEDEEARTTENAESSRRNRNFDAEE